MTTMHKSGIQDERGYAFSEMMLVKLELESDGKKEEIFASHIEKFELELFSYGFEGMVCFRGFGNDKLQEIFESDKKIEAVLSYQTKTLVEDKKDPVKVQGVVYKRTARGIENGKLEIREYTLHFCDGAKTSWSNHFPQAVYIEKTMKDVIDQEKNALVQIDYDWEVLNEEHPVLAYNLYYDAHKSEEDQISFYSFLHWYLEEEGGVLEYNYEANSYKILGKKSAEGKPTPIVEWLIYSPSAVYPPPPRWTNKALKPFPDRIDDNVEENEKGFEEVRRDWIDKEVVKVFPELDERKVDSPLLSEKTAASFWVSEFGDEVQLATLFPGQLVEFKGKKDFDNKWCDHALYKDKTFRLQSLYFRGGKEVFSQEKKVEIMPFRLALQVTVEEKDETFIPRPQYCAPEYPFYSPGEVFCEVGEEEQTTVNVKKNEDLALRVYQVKVPLAGEEEKYVICPYRPDFLPGHFYFPLYKKQQVMVAFWFKGAKVHRTLDHQPLTELAEDVQACQIVFASEGMNKYLFMKHEYEEGKNSVYTLKQSSSEQQTQVMTMKEKEMSLYVENQGKRKLTVNFNQDKGLLVEIQDEEGGMTHSTFYDPKGITHTSKSNDKTSTVKQTPDKVAIQADTIETKCKEFIIDAEKVITLKGGSKVLLDTPLAKATQDMTVG